MCVPNALCSLDHVWQSMTFVTGERLGPFYRVNTKKKKFLKNNNRLFSDGNSVCMYRQTNVLSYDKHGYTHSDNKGEINQDERQGDGAIAKSKFS